MTVWYLSMSKRLWNIKYCIRPTIPNPCYHSVISSLHFVVSFRHFVEYSKPIEPGISYNSLCSFWGPLWYQSMDNVVGSYEMSWPSQGSSWCFSGCLENNIRQDNKLLFNVGITKKLTLAQSALYRLDIDEVKRQTWSIHKWGFEDVWWHDEHQYSFTWKEKFVKITNIHQIHENKISWYKWQHGRLL